MTAIDFLKNKGLKIKEGIEADIPMELHPHVLIHWMEEYSTHSAQERYKKAYEYFYCNNQVPGEYNPHTTGDIIRTKGLKIASGLKTEKGEEG